ncbi:hypothetical protein ACFW9S_38085 [Streptomyces anulatus]|uniref:hypothetical protein n=1 Tax=Streptomyces TaxID=1883 RepID=UPI000B2B5B18|nr:hypothetical protein [Streptomyces sp. CB02115]
MVDAVVQLLTQLASGTAAAVGTGLGQEVSVLVRERLGASEQGRSAVQAVDEQPGNAEAVDELRSLIQSEIDTDPDFARRIAAAMAPPMPTEPPVATVGSIRIDSTTMRGRNTISLGSVTFNNTRTVRFSLVAVALAFVGLVALGLYGGARLVTDNNAEQQKSVAALSPDMLRRVIPGTGSMPGKWTQPDPPSPAGSREEGFVAGSGVDFLMGEPDTNLDLIVLGYDTEQKASSIWRQVTQQYPKEKFDKSGMTVNMPDIADEMWAVAGPATDEEPAGGVVIMRVGTVVMLVRGADSDEVAFSAHRMEAIATMMALRAQEAQNGESPTAHARGLH